MRSDTRVILIGRTGLDAALRLDESLELVRVRSPLDAVGELAHAVRDEMRSVVVVGPEIESALSREETADDNHIGQAPAATLAEFVAGLRIVDPAVRVVGISGERNGAGTLAHQTIEAAPYDATLSTDADIRAFVAAMSEEAGGSVDASVRDAGHSPEAPDLGGAAEVDSISGFDSSTDGVLVECLLKGQDVLAAALQTLAARMGGEVGFVAKDQALGQGPSVVVERDGVFFGWLTFAGIDPRALDGGEASKSGAWLAAWLRLRDQHQQLRAAAFTDPLTGAWNRRYFERFLGSCLDQARMKHRHVMVLVFDIDDFKKYNDAFGHDAGDEILVEAVKLMRSVIRPTDRVCRIGGDEFAVVFHDPEGPRIMGSKNAVSVVEIAQRFRNQMIQHRFPKLAQMARGTLTISGGMATFPWDGSTPAELLCKADQLALEAKRNGKNAITFGPGAAKACEQADDGPRTVVPE